MGKDMIEFNHIESEALTLIVKSHLSQRPKFSNYFFANLDFVTYYETPNTLILRKAFDSFNRIYFLSSDSAELANCLSQLGTNDIINIPSNVVFIVYILVFIVYILDDSIFL